MFGKFLKGFGVLSVFVGVLTIMGSAGDCDGKCMDQANSFTLMLTLIAYGGIAVTGGLLCWKAGDIVENS